MSDGSPVGGRGSLEGRTSGKLCIEFRVEESGSDGW